MSLLVDVQLVPNKILEVVKARIMANRARLLAEQETAQVRGATRPRVQRPRFGATATTYRRPEPAAVGGEDPIFMAFVNTDAINDQQWRIYVNDRDTELNSPQFTDPFWLEIPAIRSNDFAIGIIWNAPAQKIFDRIDRELNFDENGERVTPFDAWQAMLQLPAGQAIADAYGVESFDVTIGGPMPPRDYDPYPLPGSRYPFRGKRNRFLLKQYGATFDPVAFDVISGSPMSGAIQIDSVTEGGSPPEQVEVVSDQLVVLGEPTTSPGPTCIRIGPTETEPRYWKYLCTVGGTNGEYIFETRFSGGQ